MTIAIAAAAPRCVQLGFSCGWSATATASVARTALRANAPQPAGAECRRPKQWQSGLRPRTSAKAIAAADDRDAQAVGVLVAPAAQIGKQRVTRSAACMDEDEQDRACAFQ